MGKKNNPEHEQFSKRLARWTVIYTFLYLVLLLAGMCYEPQIAPAAIYLGVGCILLLIFNVVQYTKNSLGEKAIIAGITATATRLKLPKWKDLFKQNKKQDESTDESEEESDDESEESEENG
jgi:phosphatidylglycerophosphate synthase